MIWVVICDRKPNFTMRLPSSEPGKGLACPAQVFTFRSRTWSYRGEGNANLVLAVPNECAIVRLRKCPRSEAADGERIWREVEFSRGVMQPLLGESFVHIPAVVRISPWELECLNQQLRPLRPEHRHHKSVFGEFAAVFPDLCLLPSRPGSHAPTFCVEIKPKQGWIPFTDRRLPKCTFCLNQFLKLQNQSISERSGYCPLDLFSGDPQRMKSAILALIQCPQNNFKLFCNGILQYGEGGANYRPILESWFGSGVTDHDLLENVCSVLLQALIADCGDANLLLTQPVGLGSTRQLHQSRIPRELLEKAERLLVGPSCYRPASELPPGSILSRILRIQQLDELGSDEVYRLYSAGLDDDYEYVEELLQNPMGIFTPLHAYLLATTAKDCSILIAFQLADGSHCGRNIIQDLNGTRFRFSIGVSDLDPKPMSCIEKHKKRDLEIVRSCIDWLEGCKAQNSLEKKRII